jgi:hypothetical protein
LSVKGAYELQSRTERRSIAAIRSTDFVRRRDRF